MRITLYKGLGFAHETVEVEAGKPLCESLPDVDFGHAAVVVNAVKSDGSYCPKESDGVMVRLLPEGPVVAAVIGVISIVATVAAGVVAGVMAYRQKQELERQKKELEKLRNSMSSASTVNLPFLRGATNQLATGKSQPYVMGRNLFAPYLLTKKWYELEGVDGRDQFVTQVFECGFGKQLLESVRADDVLLKAYGAAGGPQEGCENLIDDSQAGNFSAGGKIEVAQDGGLFSVITQANVRVASDTPQAEIPYASDLLSGKKDKLVYTLDPCAKNVRLAITFAGGVYALDQNTGAKVPLVATVAPYYSLDGGTTWTMFTFRQANFVRWDTPPYEDQIVFLPIEEYPSASWRIVALWPYTLAGYVPLSEEWKRIDGVWGYEYLLRKINPAPVPVYAWTDSNAFLRNTVDEIRFEAVKEFTFADYQTLKANGQESIMIQVINHSVSDTNARNSAHLLYYESQCFDPDKSKAPAGVLSAEEYAEKFPSGTGLENCDVVSEKARLYSTMAAIRMRASASNDSKLDKINFVTRSVARVWDGEDWSSQKKPTNNPAAIMLEILTSPTHPLSAFQDSELDLDAFGGLYEFCDEEGMEFSAVQTQKAMKSKLLEQVCAVCRASLYWNAEGKLSVAWDCEQDTIVAALDSDSVISVENEKELVRPVDAMNITYLDSGTWTQKVYTVFNNGVTELTPDSVIKDLSVTGITSLEQIVKYARYTMACMNIRKKTVSVKVGNEGVCFSPCTRITVLDDSLGDTAQNLLVTSAQSDGTGWTLKCVDYDARIYNSGDIPSYKSTIEQLGLAPSGMPVQYVRKAELEDLKAGMSSGEVEIGSPDSPTLFLCKAEKDGILLKCEPLGDGLRNSVATVYWQVGKIPEGESEVSTWVTFESTPELETEYKFNRSTDGYPEYDAFSSWRFRARVKNSYDKMSDWSDAVTPAVSGYGSWALGKPYVWAKSENRLVTLKLSIPERADLREIYGNIRYRVQIKRTQPDYVDSDWYKPAVNADPSASEDNYKNGSGYALSDGTYIQNLPLVGQSNDDMINTQYTYRVMAENEAGTSVWSDEITVLALFNNIADFVKANKTAKKEIVLNLSALCASLGTITDGALSGSDDNFWDLSSFTDDEGKRHYKGKFRVGGTDQYILVDPVLDNGVPTGEYTITFKVGNFEVSSTSSSINGNLIVRSSDDALDQTIITPNGTFYQHREDADSPWTDIAASHANGTMTKQVFSPDTMVITNQSMVQRRSEGYDIGNTYLSSASKVYHFDDDYKDQNQVDDLTFDGTYARVGKENSSTAIDFTPAILAVAPYATDGKSVYGQFSLERAIGTTDKFTVDFWIQYIFAESQVLFSIGNTYDKIELKVSPDEIFFEIGLGDVSGIPFNEEIALDAPHDYVLVSPDKPWNNGYKYYEKVIVEGMEVYSLVSVTEADYPAMVAAGLYERTLPFNTPKEAVATLSHVGRNDREDVELKDIGEHGVEFLPNEWIHIGIVFNQGVANVFLNKETQPFTLYDSASRDCSMVLNATKNSFILDELFVDGTVAEAEATFCEHTQNRIPWANLPKSDDYFILTVSDLENFKTNIFDTDLFKQKVRELINEYHTT